MFLLLCFMSYVKWRTQILKVIRKMKKGFIRGIGAISEGFTILGIMTRQIRDGKKNPELQFFDFESIVSATNNFAEDCKLGQGGFGPVYKGVLGDGLEVAIKRLSKNSGQGLEFKNETILIAKLQHTNLVRLIGCCIDREEKLLVYEYMPNKSLDSFLFDSEKKLILDWDKRFHIIQGIVQGLLYLHYYSRVRKIHRDLKVSNILLDNEMNAKISDFGMARVFKPSEHEANTSRVVGTYGYISPEYAMEGIFSIKSDVYSFGILLLEIITGKKNYNNYDTERPLNLIGYAWELWVNGRGEELIDSDFCNSDQKPKVLRCIHVGLLCVQQAPADRPTMLDVYLMINNDSTQVLPPKQPAFFISQNPNSSELEPEVVDSGRLIRPAQPPQEICSLSTMSVSVMVAR
ncbi:LOW QUALITY PROTEIN: G-type lectin S-receptor-like serine/threonine-protein kinase CES101 [Cucurbita maxima]|uniref:non-specific serine/threonine protein kinase n=1 Tax=Cucurbita maxima TaxID=3661 RepID=A0A6J1JPC0_CUCMA|nr:LOW QUALITY PROTEIN: G-type lectin S-receptor-like serine/threonine-protein kinase CES101 [Cucurbita maxima]